MSFAPIHELLEEHLLGGVRQKLPERLPFGARDAAGEVLVEIICECRLIHDGV